MPPSDFHNPYNFVPAPPRVVADPNLGDHHPAGHGTYLSDHYSGSIRVTLTTVTPLLLPDAARAQKVQGKDDHWAYPVRIDATGKPYLPPTSIKGMLRAAYEAVTNSRLAIFQKHEDRLAWRMPAKTGPIPARVEARGDQLYLRLMEDNRLIGLAAKLPRYSSKVQAPDRGASEAALKYEGTEELPHHGDPVWVQLSNNKVSAIERRDPKQTSKSGWEKGWACVTGANINGKKFERVFIEHDDDEQLIIETEGKKLWEELIRNYQDTHKKDLKKRENQGDPPNAYLGDEPGKTAWSRHIYSEDELTLEEGRLCYAIFDRDNYLVGLTPVTISRRLFKHSPDQLLEASLKPAVDIHQLSPADRVFGWVRQDKPGKDPTVSRRGAYKGNVRISPVTCDSENPIENFGGQGFTLAILGQPQPQQFRFYTAKNSQGEALRQGAGAENAYQRDHGLRGRKVYPHHRNLSTNYWQNPTQNNEYSGNEQNNQNRSILGWVKPETEFSFTLEVTNLSLVELGALLWLLGLASKDYCFRLGGGKPLGFGSVHLSPNGLLGTKVHSGVYWQTYYRSLRAAEESSPAIVSQAITAYQDAVVAAYGKKNQSFEDIPMIKAFLVAGQGFTDGLPTHYPRTDRQPNPKGEAFEWFVQNASENGKKYSLPNLWDDQGLKRNPKT